MGDYEKLHVWQRACVFADKVERFVDTLPRHVRERVRGQLVRAAHSIHENIAEGCGYDSDRQLAKYLGHALGTANESEDQLLALERQDCLIGCEELLVEIRRICAMLAVLRRKVEDSIAKGRGGGSRPSRHIHRRPRADDRSRQLSAESDSREPAPEADSQEPSE